MEHYKARTNDFFHFTNPHDDVSELDDDDAYDESQYYEVDDDRSCDFNFYTYRPLGNYGSAPANSQIGGVMNQDNPVELEAFDNETLILQLDYTMKNISDKLQHTIEGIGSQISHLEDNTCKLDYYVEDVKNSEERYHGTTHRKLRQMQSILQEVQDGVVYLRDKHEIAETQLQLAILRGSKRERTNIASRLSCSKPFLNQQSNELTLSQPFYHPVFSQTHEVTAQQYIIPPNHHMESQLSNTSFIKFSNPRNYKSEFHAKYMPEFANFSNIHCHGEPSSSYDISNLKPVEPFLNPQQESSRSNYIHTHITQTPPLALPTAIDVKEESRLNENTLTVDDIVDQVIQMGFRRDVVRACVRELRVNRSPVDLNSVLDKMMKNK